MHEPASPLLRLCITVLALIGAAISAYLLWAVLFRDGSAPGCIAIGGADCDAVLNSRWSQWLGLPVSGFAVVVYASMAVAVGFVGKANSIDAREWAWLALMGLAVSAAASAVWFIALQALVIGSGCVFCMAVHGCGMIILALTLVFGPFRGDRGIVDQPIAARLGLAEEAESTSDFDAIPRRQLALPLVGSTLAVITLILGQWFVEPPLEVVEVQPTEAEQAPPSRPSATPTVQETSQVPEAIAVDAPPPQPSRGDVADDSEDTDAAHREAAAAAATSSIILPPTASTAVSILHGSFKLDSQELPAIGSPSATHTAIRLHLSALPHASRLSEGCGVALRRPGGGTGSADAHERKLQPAHSGNAIPTYRCVPPCPPGDGGVDRKSGSLCGV